MCTEEKKQAVSRLCELSNQFRTIREAKIKSAKTAEEAVFWASKTINSFLIEAYSAKLPEGDLCSFSEWKKRNKTILKGAKGFPIWGKPVKIKRPDEEEGVNGEFFPIKYLFHSSQVVDRK